MSLRRSSAFGSEAKPNHHTGQKLKYTPDYNIITNYCRAYLANPDGNENDTVKDKVSKNLKAKANNIKHFAALRDADSNFIRVCNSCKSKIEKGVPEILYEYSNKANIVFKCFIEDVSEEINAGNYIESIDTSEVANHIKIKLSYITKEGEIMSGSTEVIDLDYTDNESRENSVNNCMDELSKINVKAFNPTVMIAAKIVSEIEALIKTNAIKPIHVSVFGDIKLF